MPLLRERFLALWRQAPATWSLVGVTTLVSLVLILLDLVGVAAIGGGFIPAMVGAKVTLPPDAPLMLPVWITPLSATLVHGGLAHILLNMFALVICGRAVEQALGGRGVAILYLVGAYAAAAGQWAQDPGSTMPMVGASGAVSALLGAFALLFGRSRARAIGPIPARTVTVLWLAAAWIGVQLLTGIAGLSGGPLIAIGAHIGGFLAGLLLARPLLLWRYRKA
jgi:membrane associated rhomboid family serine protease